METDVFDQLWISAIVYICFRRCQVPQNKMNLPWFPPLSKAEFGGANGRSHCGLILPDFSPSVLRFSTSSAFVKQQTFILSMTFFSSLIDHQSKQWYLQTPKLLVITGQSQCQFVWFGKTKLFLSVVVKIDAIYNRLRKSETMGGMLHRRGAPPPSIHPEVFADCLSDRWQHSQWDRGALSMTSSPVNPWILQTLMKPVSCWCTVTDSLSMWHSEKCCLCCQGTC